MSDKYEKYGKPTPEHAAFLREFIEDVIEHGWEEAFSMWEYSYEEDYGFNLWGDGKEDTDNIHQIRNEYSIIGTLMGNYWRRKQND